MSDDCNWHPGAKEWIATVLVHAEALRKAGVTAIGASGCTAQLAPWSPPVEAPKDERAPSDPEPPDALNDPATYPGGIVPGYKIYPLGEEPPE